MPEVNKLRLQLRLRQNRAKLRLRCTALFSPVVSTSSGLRKPLPFPLEYTFGISSRLRRKKNRFEFSFFQHCYFFPNFVICFSISFIVSSTSIHVYSTSTSISVKIFFFIFLSATERHIYT